MLEFRQWLKETWMGRNHDLFFIPWSPRPCALHAPKLHIFWDCLSFSMINLCKMLQCFYMQRKRVFLSWNFLLFKNKKTVFHCRCVCQTTFAAFECRQIPVSHTKARPREKRLNFTLHNAHSSWAFWGCCSKALWAVHNYLMCCLIRC